MGSRSNRLNVVPIWVPPLRARRDDIELLARAFCATSCRGQRQAPRSGSTPGAPRCAARSALAGKRAPASESRRAARGPSPPASSIGAADVNGALSTQVRFVTQDRDAAHRRWARRPESRRPRPPARSATSKKTCRRRGGEGAAQGARTSRRQPDGGGAAPRREPADALHQAPGAGHRLTLRLTASADAGEYRDRGLRDPRGALTSSRRYRQQRKPTSLAA